jgi:arylsulfatase A-like enzyme
VVDEMVLNVDLAPTFLELAELSVPASMQGRSWKPLASGKPVDDWRTCFVAHYYKELGDTPTCVALRTAEKKLVVYPGRPEWTEVFDLEEDPYEIKNLASDISLRDALRRQLDAQMEKLQLPMLR